MIKFAVGFKQRDDCITAKTKRPHFVFLYKFFFIFPLFSFLGNMPTFGAADTVKGGGPHHHGEGLFHCQADNKGDGLSVFLVFHSGQRLKGTAA